MKNNSCDVLIIGAGASGLMCGAYLAYLNNKNNSSYRICILEKNSKNGRKLSATGNGRCNLSNKLIDSADYFNSDNNPFINSLLAKYNHKFVKAFFEDELGLKCTYINDLCYPATFRSSTVIDALINYCNDNNVQIINDINVDNTYLSEFDYKYLILACGGAVLPNSGSDGNGYKLAQNLVSDISLINPLPGLVQLNSIDKSLKSLSGNRYNVSVSVNVTNNIYVERGELLFTDYGISGICVMQLSSKIMNNYRITSKFSEVVVDFFPETTDQHVYEELINRMNKFVNRTIVDCFSGLIRDSLINVVLKRLNINKINANELSDFEIKKISKELKNFKIRISGATGFENAQVTLGGISMSNFKDNTLEFKNASNIFAIGEILNVDGPCGGFNLHWAWASAMKVSDDIMEKIK